MSEDFAVSDASDQIKLSLRSDLSDLKNAQALLMRCHDMHDSKLRDIIMLVGSEIALREYELEIGERLFGSQDKFTPKPVDNS